MQHGARIRMDPADALMLQFESPDTHFHTLKVVTLAPAEGGALSLADLERWVPQYLSISPRLTHRVVRRSYWRWYWAPDDDFDISSHLSERTVSGTAGLDDLCGELAADQLDRRRPLWRLTLVNGLPGGEQAVIAQVHHAVMDGSAAMNLFSAVTSESRGSVPPAQLPSATTLSQGQFTEGQFTQGQSTPRRLPALLSAWVDLRRRTKEFELDDRIPRSFLRRTRLNPYRSGARRLCASQAIDLADLRVIADFLGTNINGAVHAALAVAVRDYLIAQGDRPRHPVVVNLGVAEDPQSQRCDGNKLATARLWFRIEEPDPVRLATRTAESTSRAVALRRQRGFEFQRQANAFAWTIPAFRRWFVDLPPLTPVHLLSAYVAGPRGERWFGNVAATGFRSYAVSVAPTDLSITAYRYAGQVWIGVVVTPEAMPDPRAFTSSVTDAVRTLLGHAHRRSFSA